ncbi:Dbl homology domain-containing protein [Circinella umbellata]|nr:Dbl homology domain-containing protein [Circinella umbellata]
MSNTITKKRNTWANSGISTQTLLSTPVHEQSRQEAIFALIRNERYFRNELDILYTRLIQPLYEFDHVDPQERALFIHSVFKNLSAIKRTHHKLVSELTERQKEFASLVPTVSDVFSAHILPILDEYQVYCSNLPRATYLLTTHTEFPQQLTQKYWPLIKKPLEHLQRYPALLEAVIDATKSTVTNSVTTAIITPKTTTTTTTTLVDNDDHPDNEILQLCLDAIRLCLDNINDQLKIKKQLLDIEKWVGNTWQLDAQERRIMYRCRVSIITMLKTDMNSHYNNSDNKKTSREGEIVVLDHVVLVLLPPVLSIPLPIVICVPDSQDQSRITLAHPPRGITYPVQLLDSSSEQLISAIQEAQKELKQKQPTIISRSPLVSSTFESWTSAVRLPSSSSVYNGGSLVVGSRHGVTIYPSRQHIIDIDVSGLAILSSLPSLPTYLVIASHRCQLILLYKINSETNDDNDSNQEKNHWKEQQPLVIENVLDGFHVIDHYVIYQDKTDMLVHQWSPRKRRTIKTIDVQSS